MRLLTTLFILLILSIATWIFYPLISVYIGITTTQLWHIKHEVVQDATLLPFPDTQTRYLSWPKSAFWLAIPRLGIVSPVDESVDFHSTAEQERALSQNHLIHAENSGLPGQLGTMIFSAHYLIEDNWPSINPHYFFVKTLVPEDLIVVGRHSQTFNYEIISIEKVESVPDLTPDYSTQNLLLLASDPFISGPRYRIKAELVD